MTVSMSTGLKQGLLASSGVDEQFLNCTIHFYSGAQPANADAATTGTRVAQATIAGGAFVSGSATNGLNFGAPVAGVLSKEVAENWTIKGIAAGTIGWFRIVGNAADNELASTTLPRLDGVCGINTGDMRLTTVTTTIGSIDTINTFTIAFAT